MEGHIQPLQQRPRSLQVDNARRQEAVARREEMRTPTTYSSELDDGGTMDPSMLDEPIDASTIRRGNTIPDTIAISHESDLPEAAMRVVEYLRKDPVILDMLADTISDIMDDRKDPPTEAGRVQLLLDKLDVVQAIGLLEPATSESAIALELEQPAIFWRRIENILQRYQIEIS